MSVTRCAVLGSPIAHSLSPSLHRAAYAHLALRDWTYEAIEVPETDLERFLDGLDDTWRGLSLTMPLKRQVVSFVDTLDAWAQLSGVANTVVLGGGRAAFNTDVPGAVAAVRERTEAPIRSAAVVGGGATATSVLLALAELGCERAVLLVRDPARARPTVESVRAHPRAPEVSVTPLGEVSRLAVDLVVSTVPAAAQSPALLAATAAVPTVFEVVYDPWPTPLAAATTDSGRVLVSGLDLLAHQAARQVELMTGRAVPVDVLREAGRRELHRRAVQNTVGEA